MTSFDPDCVEHLIKDDLAQQRIWLGKFFLAAQAHVDSIEAYLSLGDLGGAANTAHKLKASARTCGAIALGDLCEQIETAGRAGDAMQCQALGAQLRPVLDAVKAIISTRYGIA